MTGTIKHGARLGMLLSNAVLHLLAVKTGERCTKQEIYYTNDRSDYRTKRALIERFDIPRLDVNL